MDNPGRNCFYLIRAIIFQYFPFILCALRSITGLCSQRLLAKLERPLPCDIEAVESITAKEIFKHHQEVKDQLWGGDAVR
jgi:hypothetical protein